MKPTRNYSDKQERQVAKMLKGKVTKNSGATMYGGGDVKTDDFLIECKTVTSEKTSFSVKKQVVDKIAEQAYEQNKSYWAISSRFSPDGEDYFTINSSLFKYLVEKIKGEEENGKN